MVPTAGIYSIQFGNLALKSKHYYSYLFAAIWPVLLQLSFLLIPSSVVRQAIQNSEVANQIAFFLNQKPNRIDSAFLAGTERNGTRSQKSILKTPNIGINCSL